METIKASAFRIIIIFVLLMVIGISVIPLLDLNYRPSRKNNSITISYSWYQVSPEIIEREVTSKLEGTLATLQGISEIYSESSGGTGHITLKFSGIPDPQLLRFEIATLIRQVTASFPKGVSYPVVRYGGAEVDQTLMTYTLNGKYSPQELQEYAGEKIRRPLSEIRELQEVAVYGAEPVEWVISYDLNQLAGLGLSPSDLTMAVQSYLDEFPLGLATIVTDLSDRLTSQNEETGIYLTSPYDHQIPWEKIPVIKKGDRIIYLASVCSIHKAYQEPRSYYRINGLNSINIVIIAAENVNELVAGKAVKQKVRQLEEQLPQEMSLSATYDTTEHLQEELFDILWRIGLSLVILLLFVWLTSRNLAYLSIVMAGIFCNILVAFIFYYFLGIEIQLYSLAGLTISLGIIIDNTIVMIDHVRNHQNKKVFLSILAATLTTVGSLGIIYFLDEEQVLMLIDFAYVLAINLLVSLAVSLYFIPALMEKIRVRKRISKRVIRNKRRVVKFGKAYLRMNRFLSRIRIAVFVILIFGFGLPVFMLPEELGQDEPTEDDEATWYENWYNSTLGNPWYRENVHPVLEKWMGGSLYLFYRNIYTTSYYGEPERTTLYVNGSMPPGATIQQMNDVFMELENFISQFDEVDQFETRISGTRNAVITIRFKPEYELTPFPYYLKARLTGKAISLGGLDTGIYGVGRGFSNALNTGYRNTNLYLYGYSYQALVDHAEHLRERLLVHERIREVDILGAPSFFGGPTFEYYFDFDPRELVRQGVSPSSLNAFLSQVNLSDQLIWRGNIEGQVANLKIRPRQAALLDIWNIKNYPVTLTDSSMSKLAGLADISRRKASEKIVRKNQQYQLVLAFDYIGSGQLRKRVVDQFITETNATLPIGYFMEERGYWWRQDEASQYWLIGLVIAIIFLIGATLFESFRQPLFVILTIPVAFIGVFLTFYLFDLNFDQGGYASFILLSGISVNAGFFIFNDLNNLRKEQPRIQLQILYLKAFQRKVLPVLLTILSTIAGMVPFLIEGTDQVFWFALAAGTFGGLLFSLVGVLLLLPLVVRKQVID